MPVADKWNYTKDIVDVMKTHWPHNQAVNIVCHGHSVPAGYTATPFIDTFHAYPHLLHLALKERFPYALINAIVTAIGGENGQSGAQRFERDVLCHQPGLVTIDYGLNDRRLSLLETEKAWSFMIETALSKDVKILLLTPTWDTSVRNTESESWRALVERTSLIRQLACRYEVGLVDSFAAFERHYDQEGDFSDLLSWSNHPNSKGHMLVANELLRWFPA